MDAACCTCAKQLPGPDFADESKSSVPPRQLECCNRLICNSCQQGNPRFRLYCPFCQISSEPSSLPQGLRDPPGYDDAIEQTSRNREAVTIEDANAAALPERERGGDEPPAYASVDPHARPGRGDTGAGHPPDVLHHLRPSDTVSSLSLAYRVPSSVLRSHNSIFSDGLLAARRSISVPGSYYQGPSLSSEPLESEEERAWKAKLRRFMVASKCSDYSVAELYLKQASEDVDGACQAWEADERWERENPYNRDKQKTSRLSRSKQAVAQRTM